MSYLEFHFIFLLPPILSFWAVAIIRRHLSQRRFGGMLLLAVIAFLYTTPWDNYLVSAGIWSYGTDRVIDTIGYVPVEEYAFFILQTVMVCLWHFMTTHPGALKSSGKRISTVPGLLVLFLAGIAGIVSLGPKPTTYLGLILVWSVPVLMLQWYFGASLLWNNVRIWTRSVVPMTLYLWIADGVAIERGVWAITADTITGLHIVGLPIEEALFFFVTTVLVVQGMMLIEGWKGRRKVI